MSNNDVFGMETVPMRFGWGVLNELPYDVINLGLKKVLLVTDPLIAELPFFQSAYENLIKHQINVVIYSGVHSEPTESSWRNAFKFAKENGPFDGYISIGGGSSIDTAKAINLYDTYPEDLFAYINKPIGEAKEIPGPLKPHIACPTTAGTGSESTTVAVVDLTSLSVKSGVSYKKLKCTLALIDPQTTLSIPKGVIASCALDVLTHALESFTTLAYDQRPKVDNPNERPPFIGANPISNLWSEKSMQLVAENIIPAWENDNDEEALTNLMLASTYAGLGFGNAGVHIPHAMGYPIAGLCKGFIPEGYPGQYEHVPHGMSVTLGAPAVFKFLNNAIPERMFEAAKALSPKDSSVSTQNAGDVIANILIDILKKLNFPNGLSALGFTENDIPALVEGTLKQQRLLINSPIKVGEKELIEIYKNTMVIW